MPSATYMVKNKQDAGSKSGDFAQRAVTISGNVAGHERDARASGHQGIATLLHCYIATLLH